MLAAMRQVERLLHKAAPAANVQKSAPSHNNNRWPRGVANPPGDSGATGIGRHGKKYRVLSNGAKKAMPSPPSVIASKKPCEAMTSENNSASRVHVQPSAHPARVKRNA